MSKYDVSADKCQSYDKNETKSAPETAPAPIGGLDWVEYGVVIAIKANLVTFAKPKEAVTKEKRLNLKCILIEWDN